MVIVAILVAVGILKLIKWAREGFQNDVSINQQMWLQSLKAATPNKEDLAMASNTPMTPIDAQQPGSWFSLYNPVQNTIPNDRAIRVSPCAQNAPTFVATDLLPKTASDELQQKSGLPSWNVNAPANVLANQNFLSAAQRIGTDTVMSSNKNASYDIRRDIPNPWVIPSIWNISTIQPDLPRRPLDCDSNLWEGTVYSCKGSVPNKNLVQQPALVKVVKSAPAPAPAK